MTVTPANPPISYRSTIYACYLGNIIMAVIINLTPIIFIPLREQFGLTFEMLGRLVFINFTTQVATDLFFSRFVDKHGVRPYIVAAQLLAAGGLALFAAAPLLFERPYLGFMIATVIFSASSGLMELLLSPIVNAIPTDEKAAAMSMLHSFYSWGQLVVVLLTTVLLLVLGHRSWPLIVLMWTTLPLINLIVFLRVPLAPMVAEEHRTPIRRMLKSRFFLVVLVGIALGGASELVMAQWTSTFMEKALNLPKILGDVAGVCTFALMMGIGRAVYGKLGSRINLYHVMMGGSLLAFVCYLVVVFSPFPALSLVACALSGLGVCLLWPGSLVISSERFPLAGASMFAILAAGGDTGAAFGPWMVGLLADYLPTVSRLSLEMGSEQFGLRAGVLVGSIFPLGMFFVVRWLRDQNKRAIQSGASSAEVSAEAAPL